MIPAFDMGYDSQKHIYLTSFGLLEVIRLSKCLGGGDEELRITQPNKNINFRKRK